MKKILVANRGEIALRVMKTAREMGIKTVAVYSEADRHSPHVRYADEAILLGPPPSSESYLLGDVIIEKAKALNVDAIHPGYGFLSENKRFVEIIEEHNIKFIGPKSTHIEMMGNKIMAKKIMEKSGVQNIPGLFDLDDIDKVKKFIDEIGLPVIIKAASGGGGKGMRIVNDINELNKSISSAKMEAKKFYNDDTVYLEKFLKQPKHIEIQVLADAHENVITLGERDCSIQRRHQKLIEECPSINLKESERKKLVIYV